MMKNKREIWTYPGSGFMETVSFGVEWLSEDEFKNSDKVSDKVRKDGTA